MLGHETSVHLTKETHPDWRWRLYRILLSKVECCSRKEKKHREFFGLVWPSVEEELAGLKYTINRVNSRESIIGKIR